MLLINDFRRNELERDLRNAIEKEGGLRKFCDKNICLSPATVSRVSRGDYQDLKMGTVLNICDAIRRSVVDYCSTLVM